MKLYIVYNKKTEEVVGHTRKKDVFDKYIEGLNRNKFKIIKMDSGKVSSSMKKEVEDTIRDIEDKYFEKTISPMPYLDEVVVEDDKDIFKFAEEEFNKLEILRGDLSNIIKNYDIPKEDKKALKKSLKILNDLSKKKNFDKAVGLDVIREVVKNNPLIKLKKMFNI